MEYRKWNYEKLDENGNVKYCPINDTDGSITGKHIIGLREYFDEHPEERIRLGWIKHIIHRKQDIEYNRQRSYRQIDPYTIEDEYTILDKTEEMMLLEEMIDSIGLNNTRIVA